MYRERTDPPRDLRIAHPVTKLMRKTCVFSVTIVLLFGVSLSSFGCISRNKAKNIQSLDELEGRKVLAGRIVIYEGDKRVEPDQGRYDVMLYKKGQCESCYLDWDSDGYIYTPVEEGTCHFTGFGRSICGTGDFFFVTDVYPAVVVDPNDSIANFGTIELHFHQSDLSQASAFILGIAKASVRLDCTRDHDVTQAELIEKLGATEEQIRDVNVVWLKRRKD